MAARTHGDWLTAKRALEAYKLQHRRSAPRGCRCALCLSPQELRALLDEKLARQRQQTGEAPF